MWVFVLMLCCPFDVEHRITFEARTEVACEKMRKVVAQQSRTWTLRLTVPEKCEPVVPVDTTTPPG